MGEHYEKDWLFRWLNIGRHSNLSEEVWQIWGETGKDAMNKEATITVNDVVLTDAQSATVRVALTILLAEMQNPKSPSFGKRAERIAAGYRDQSQEVLELVFRS